MAQSNSNSNLLALLLKDSRKGTFTGLITRKVGVVRGRGENRKRFGDDQVHVTMVTGFRYENLVARSLKQLDQMDLDLELTNSISQGIVDGHGNPLTKEDFQAAFEELKTSFQTTLDPAKESTSTTKGVFDPLVIDGETVRGSRVYRCTGTKNCGCRNCNPDNPKAPLPGTIYLQGLKIHQTILEKAPNGPAPMAKSKAKTVAKNFLKNQLPVSRYVSYRLEPGTDFILRAGGTAETEAVNNGFVVTDDVINVLTRCA